MKICIDVTPELNARLMDYIIATYGDSIMGRKSEVMRDALSEYLSNPAIDRSANRTTAQKSTASASIEKTPEKRIAPTEERAEIPPETKKQIGRKWHGGKAPYDRPFSIQRPK